MLPSRQHDLSAFLHNKPAHTLALFDHFVTAYQSLGPVTLHPTKTMIAVDNGQKRIAWITQLGKNFIHVVFPFQQPYEDNLCFQKIAQVPGSNQFNHHLRVLLEADINDEGSSICGWRLRDKTCLADHETSCGIFSTSPGARAPSIPIIPGNSSLAPFFRITGKAFCNEKP